MKVTLNELKLVVAEMLEEARKKAGKANRARRKPGTAALAYGMYDEALDFSAPLGAYNLYRQQGAVNWGPYTSDGPHIDSTFADSFQASGGLKEGEERALRAMVREVIENGLTPADSAWGEFLPEGREPVYETAWHEALSGLRKGAVKK